MFNPFASLRHRASRIPHPASRIPLPSSFILHPSSFLWLLALLLPITALSAATPDPLPPIPLWPGGAPGAHGTTDIDTPTLTAFLPDPAKATGAAFLVCPGGGYAILTTPEGAGYARWLNEQGIAAFVLKYRLGTNGYHHPAAFQDVTRAMRLTRSRAAEWHLDPARIAVIGSSAGGHLAALLLTHFDSGQPDAPDPVERFSSRPDLGVLCYAVITLEGAHVNTGSRHNLLGDTFTPELLHDLSPEAQIKPTTPPCFVWHFWEDQAVQMENSVEFASALRAKGIRCELHIYEKGFHGSHLTGTDTPDHHHRWTTDLLAWLGEHRWLAKP